MIKLRKLLACLMIVCMAFSLMPLAAFAAEVETPEESVCEHSFENGVCAKCGYECPHENVTDGVCEVCDKTLEQNDAQDDNSDLNGDTADDNKVVAVPQTGEGENGETANAVAKIGKTGYETLAAALEAMQPGDTVTLLEDVTGDVTFDKNGTIELSGCTITGTVTISADVTLKNGIISTSGDAVTITDGGLTLEDMTVTGNTGINVDVTNLAEGEEKAVSIVINNSTIEGNCGISSTNEKVNVGIACNDGAKIITKEYSGRAIDVVSGSFSTDGEGIELTGEIRIKNGSVNISCGDFRYASIDENCVKKNVTITGGYICVSMKDYVTEGYAYKAEGEGGWVVPGYKVSDGVTVSVDEVKGGNSSSGIYGSISCDNRAIKAEKLKDLLIASGIAFENNDMVKIEIIPKVEQKTKDGETPVVYSISPVAKISTKQVLSHAWGEAKETSITNDMLSGSEITVTVKKPNFTPQTIVHTHEDGNKSIYTSGDVESISKFRVYEEYNDVSFKVTSFGDFAMYENAIVCEVLDDKGTSQGYYDSFSAALDAVNTGTNNEAGWTIKLLQNASVAATQEIVGPWKWTIDLAGNTLNTNSFYIASSNGAHSLTIKDSSDNKSGKLRGIGTSATIDIGGNCVLTLESGTIEHTSGTAIALKDNKNKKSAQFVMNGGAVNGTTAVTASSGTVTINDGAVTGTVADAANGGTAAVVVGADVTMTLTDGSVTNANGTAIAINGTNAQFIMSGGTVNGSTKGVDMSGGSVQISSGTIEGATAINAVSGSVTISGGELDSTTADKEVVVSTSGSPTVAISGGSFAHAVPADQCADGYEPAAADASGRYSVETKPKTEPVARAKDALGVDQGTFIKIQDAVDAAKAGGEVTLLRDSGDYAKIDYALTFDGAGCRMKNLTVNSAAGVKIKNLRVGSVTVSANAKAEISSGWYGAHDGSGTYSISGGVFSDPVTQEQCALVPVFGKLTGTAASLTKYIPAQNTDPETKDAYPYTVEVAPDPRITEISDSAYFQKNSDGTLTIYTDGDYDELVKSGSTYRCLHVYNANGTDLISSRYYTVEEDANGYAVITISNSFLRNRPTGTYSVQVDFTTGVTQPEDFRVGTSPKTGDESNIGLWIGIMACSAIIIGCGVFVLIHKNKKNKK